jgi:hypothetical protein
VKLEGTRQRLAKIVGEPLSAVTFVRDYVQLHFDGPTISAFTLPTVTVRGKTIAFADPGYRDALCARIGVTVLAAFVEHGERLQIDLADDSCLVISLRPHDRVVEESAVYRDELTGELDSW